MGAENRIYIMDTRLLEDPDIFGCRYDGMPPERKRRIEGCRLLKDRRLSLGAGILLSVGLARAGASDADVAYGEGGKPFLPGGEAFFSLSHSGDMAVCAVSCAPVGVDVEAVRHFRDDLAAFVFHQGEIEAVRADGNDPDGRFTALWTVKESVMKYDGSGLRLTPKRIRVRTWDPLRVEVGGILREDLIFTGYALPGYRMTVCSAAGPFPEDPEQVDPGAL